ncbi:MAG TPA: hypothetical protein VE174_10020 [Actinomycetota bacterium]|nr:hypothetical protein [Actinomycetota bacterium]
MKTLAIALATALLAGAGVYTWRSAELADRQDRLLQAVLDQAAAELEAERLREELDRTHNQLADLAGVRCRGISSGSVPGITFVQNERLMSVGLNGGTPRCLIDLPGTATEWGPRADRLLLDNTTYVGNKRRRVLEQNENESAHWSRPQGTSIVYSENGGRRLLKIPATGGQPEDISFLAEHISFAYHPAGTHIAVAGMNKKGQLGIYIATNEGADPFLVARGENATFITGLQFSSNGRHLFFAALHNDAFHLHELGIATGEDVGIDTRALTEGELTTVMQSEDILGPPVISPFTKSRPPVAFSRGACKEHTETFVRILGDAVPIEWSVAGEQTRPLGWLPDGRLLLEVKPDGSCIDAGLLHVWDPETAEHSPLSDSAVSQVAVRAQLPKAPDPPVPAQEVPA